MNREYALAGPPNQKRRSVDPLAAVLALGDRAVRVGAVVGVALALLMHGAGAGRAMMSLRDMLLAVQSMRAGLHEYLWTMYDVELPQPEKPPEQKPPEPEPTPEPEPVAIPPPKTAAPPKEEDPYEPPPAPAQAAKVLTAPEEPGDKIEDLTDQGFVSGPGDGPGYGIVSAQGTASAPTWNPNAKVGGTPGGTGTGPVVVAPPPPPKKSLARPPGLVGSTNWNCPFPSEADAEQIDSAVVTVIVTVRPDGSPQSVKVISDPGFGFGRQARMCALGKRYTPGLDPDGNPIVQTTPPIRVSFVR